MPVTVNDDKVWFDEPRKLEEICAAVSTANERGSNVLLLSHFESTVAGVTARLREKGIHHERYSSSELCSSAGGKIWVGLARVFQVGYQATAPAQGETLEIIVTEHHPLHSRDQEIVDAAAKLSCSAEVTFYFSLDDAVMKYFGAESIKSLFEVLGIDKNESISHHLINTAIRNAQEKIERKVGKDLPAHSAADWFNYNLREQK
jgi:preprotein translocase subunit SecA